MIQLELVEKRILKMLAITLLLCSLSVLKIGQWLAIVFVDALATTIAVYYRWRSLCISHELVAQRPAADDPTNDAWAKPTRRQRRLMARHLRLSLTMTELYSLFPCSSARGYAMAEAMVRASRAAG